MKSNRILSALMIMSLLGATACGGGSGDSGGSTVQSGGATDGSASTVTESAGETSGYVSNSAILPTPAGQLPIVEEGVDVSLNLGVISTPWISDYETNYFVQWVEENTGVNLEFTIIPMDTASEKITLALSTNDVASLPDAYMNLMLAANTNTIFGASYASYWYDQDMIMPLNDMIDEYGYHYQEALAVAKEYGYNIDQWITSADGNIYSMPAFSASLTNSYPHKMWINQGWLDNLSLEMPTTTEEFREVLRAFKNDDPNGNNTADEIPMSGAKQRMYYCYDFVINAFIYNQTNLSRMYVEDGTVKFAAVRDEWRDAMIYLRELSDEGLYYAGSFTQDTNTIQQMAVDQNDILGAFEGLGHDVVVVTDDQDVIDRYNSVPALTGPDGKHYVTWNAPAAGSAGVITANCEYPEIAFRVLDFMMSEEGSTITRYGEKGVNWDDADEGTMGYYGTPAIMQILQNTWAQTGQNQNFVQGSPFILNPAIAKGIQWSGNEKEAGYIKAQAVVKLDETGIVPDEYLANLVYNDDEAAIVSAYSTDIDTYITQSVANFVAGDWDPTSDSQWESYVAEYNKMNIDEYIGAIQACYTRMTGN